MIHFIVNFFVSRKFVSATAILWFKLHLLRPEDICLSFFEIRDHGPQDSSTCLGGRERRDLRRAKRGTAPKVCQPTGITVEEKSKHRTSDCVSSC